MSDIFSNQVKGRPSQSTLLKAVPSRICSKYNKVYEDGRRVVYFKKKPYEKVADAYDTASISPSICGFFKDCTDAISYNEENRLRGGKAPPRISNVVPSLTICNVQTKQRNQEEIDVSSLKPHIIHIHIENTPDSRIWERHAKCLYMASVRRPRKMNRGTQTLYRESSAQTLPYLPAVSNNKESLETFELFKLPKILKGDGPPGLYEVEILERARKRWAFEKAIKKEFDCKMKAARSQLERKRQIAKHKHILTAFEWEHWLQREEAIQSYQMMRFDLVLRIFEKREREMHAASKIRIEKTCEEIALKRDKALKKNEIEYGREIRRLKVKHERKARNWRKEKISVQLGDPSSEYYAPQMRHGVNPNRRHFQLSHKAFEMRMEDLEKRAVNMKSLECPFAKLKEWSKPKEYKPEVEQNFCTDTNLKKLYESLKGLREQSKKQKIIPKCLKEKTKVCISEEILGDDDVTIEEFEFEDEETCSVEMDDEAVQVGASFSQNSLIEMFSQRDSNILSLAELLDERRREELESMLAEYEGTTIGWLMRFLSEEMDRLQEQRKLHFITMLAQKERWRREAAEAGLRQKESEMRRVYEEIFDETDKANADVCEQYLDNIFGIDTREQADFKAITNIKDLAKVIDIDLQRWLSSFKLIQHPLNYDDLRCLLRDLVFPDNIAECLVHQYEANSVVDYIINDVLFPNIFTLLEPFDVVLPLMDNMVDRLIDNDLYLFSSECSSGCDCYDVCECDTPELEAKAIMRKLIRRSVPGRRWRTSTERIADENVKDIVEEVCKGFDGKRCTFTPGARRRRPTITKIPSAHDLLAPKTIYDDVYDLQGVTPDTTAESSRIDTVTIIKYRKVKRQHDSITRSLSSRHGETYTKTDTNVSSTGSLLLNYKQFEPAPEPGSEVFRPSFLRKISSALDIREVPQEEILRISRDSESTDSESTDDEFENLTRTQQSVRRITDSFCKDLIDDVVQSFLPVEPVEPVEEEMEHEISEASAAQSSTGRGATRFVLDRISSGLVFDEYDNVESTHLDAERTVKFDEADESSDREAKATQITSEYAMVMYEGELKQILKDDDECKCQMEIDYKNHIKELYESGKIKIIYKEPRTSEDMERDTFGSEAEKAVSLSEMVFEYVPSYDDMTNLEQSEYVMTEGDNLSEEVAEPEEAIEEVVQKNVESEVEDETVAKAIDLGEEGQVKDQQAIEAETVPVEQLTESAAETADQDAEVKAKPAEQPAETTENAVDAAGDAFEASIEEPVSELPQDNVGALEETKDAPVEALNEDAAEVPAEAPAEAPADAVDETATEVPADAPAETPADAPEEP